LIYYINCSIVTSLTEEIDMPSTIEQIKQCAEFALEMRDLTTLLDMMERIQTLCEENQ